MPLWKFFAYYREWWFNLVQYSSGPWFGQVIRNLTEEYNTASIIINLWLTAHIEAIFEKLFIW